MAVVAEGVARVADESYELSLLDVLALDRVHRYHMTVYRSVAVGVLYHDDVAVAARIPARRHDLALLGGVYLRALGSRDIQSLMVSVADECITYVASVKRPAHLSRTRERLSEEAGIGVIGHSGVRTVADDLHDWVLRDVVAYHLARRLYAVDVSYLYLALLHAALALCQSRDHTHVQRTRLDLYSLVLEEGHRVHFADILYREEALGLYDVYHLTIFERCAYVGIELVELVQVHAVLLRDGDDIVSRLSNVNALLLLCGGELRNGVILGLDAVPQINALCVLYLIYVGHVPDSTLDLIVEQPVLERFLDSLFIGDGSDEAAVDVDTVCLGEVLVGRLEHLVRELSRGYELIVVGYHAERELRGHIERLLVLGVRDTLLNVTGSGIEVRLRGDDAYLMTVVLDRYTVFESRAEAHDSDEEGEAEYRQGVVEGGIDDAVLAEEKRADECDEGGDVLAFAFLFGFADISRELVGELDAAAEGLGELMPQPQYAASYSLYHVPQLGGDEHDGLYHGEQYRRYKLEGAVCSTDEQTCRGVGCIMENVQKAILLSIALLLYYTPFS